MSKKTTKQLKEILLSQHEYWSQHPEHIIDKINQQVEPTKLIVFAEYVADGIPMTYSYCQKCGKEKRFPSVDFRKYARACTCGNNTYKRWGRSPLALSEGEFLVPTKVDDDYFCFAFCRTGLLPCTEKTLSMEQLMREPLKWTWINFCTYGIFSKDAGVLFVDSKGNYIRRGGSAHQELLYGIDRATKIDQDSIQHLLPSGKTVVEIQSQTQNQKKKAPSAKEIPIPDWINNRISTPSPSRVKNRSLDGTIEYAFYCNQCNKMHDVIVSSPFEQLVCPTCGNEISYSSHGGRSFLFYEADENGLLNVRHINKTAVLHDDNTLESKTVELFRIVIAANAITIYEADENGILRKTKKKISSYILNNYPYFCQEDEEVFTELNKTFLSRYGFDEAHKLGVWDPLSRNGLQFIQTLHEIPQLELFVKCGMSRVAKQLCYTSNFTPQDRSAKNICDFLGISKRVFNLSRKNNLGLVEIRLLNKMMKSDPSLTWEMFKQIIDNHCERAAVKINEDHGIPFGKILDYLKRVDDYQCIPCREAIDIWRDYLSMADALKMPLHNKNVKFPTSLKKEHDRAVYAYQAVKLELDLERFHRSVEKTQNLAYKGSKYLIRVPKEPEEIVAEGESLHHCVKTYISRIRDGETSIVFLRRVEEPDTPLYTIEVRNDFPTKEVVQIRGLSNRSMKEADMRKFVHAWCNEKGLCYR